MTICSVDVPLFMPGIDNLCLLSFFLGQYEKRFTIFFIFTNIQILISFNFSIVFLFHFRCFVLYIISFLLSDFRLLFFSFHGFLWQKLRLSICNLFKYKHLLLQIFLYSLPYPHPTFFDLLCFHFHVV